MGFMDATRRAGNNEASDARISTKTAAKASANGSKGLTPKRKEPTNRETAATPTSPTAQPTIATLAEDEKTRRTTRARCAPKAIRMAISCVRRAVEKAMTLYIPSAAKSAATRAKAEMSVV